MLAIVLLCGIFISLYSSADARAVDDDEVYQNLSILRYVLGQEAGRVKCQNKCCYRTTYCCEGGKCCSHLFHGARRVTEPVEC
ncbi:unnamed protein product [Nezara viridula]|uniref:Neuropeptide n=1 Tax=Nezara viridula TaxID=85310 RepID=A0A9P0HRM4_NEZVI|nr:unnamed protein product [Nezara viridula]